MTYLAPPPFPHLHPTPGLMGTVTADSVPAITSYYGAFQDSRHIYIVMEYCARGDLLERLLSEGRAFSEVSSALGFRVLLVQHSRRF